MKRTSVLGFLATLFVALLAPITAVDADGSESLAPPSIPIAAGSGMAVGGTGMQTQPASMDVTVPPDVTVKQVLLYWEGMSFEGSPLDDTITIEGQSVTGSQIGGPTQFFQQNGQWVVSASYRADVTGLGLVPAGATTSLDVSDLAFGVANDGAGVVVIYDDGCTTNEIALRDGNDVAFANFPGDRGVTTAQTFTFAPAVAPRTANLVMQVGSVDADRPNVIRVTTAGHAGGPTETKLVDPLGSFLGSEWDTQELSINVPAGATSLTVQLFSEHDPTSTLPANALPSSMAWVNATLFVPRASSVAPQTSGAAYALDLELLGTSVIDELGRVDSADPGGPTTAADVQATIPAAPLIEAELLRTTSDSDAFAPPVHTTATSTIADVRLLGGAVRAEAVKGVSQSAAQADGASYNSNGSTITNLVVNGSQIVNIQPNTTIKVKNPLLPLQTIAELHVYEETGSSGLGGGTAHAEHSVNMLRLVLLRPLGPLAKGAEIIVGHAESQASFPIDPSAPCNATVSGEAFTAFAAGRLGNPPDDIVTAQLGLALLPQTGGVNSDELLDLDVPSVVKASTAENTTSGHLLPNPEATARAVVEDLDLLGGTITARLLDVTSTSTANGANAGTTFGCTFLEIVIGGTVLPIPGCPAPNTTIAVPMPTGEVLLVILNEQILNTDGATFSDGTIRAIHAYLLKGSGVIEGELIVASAHSDAHT